MRLLFLFLPAILAVDFPHAPGMYPPEESGPGSSTGTVPPSPYGGDSEGPYLFYYEKDPAPPSPKTLHPPGGRAASSRPLQKVKSSREEEGPVPPPRTSGSSSPDSASWAKYINNPSSGPRRETTTDSLEPVDPYDSSSGKTQTHGPSAGPNTISSSGPVAPIDPYEHSTGSKTGSTGNGRHKTHLPGLFTNSGPTGSASPVDPYKQGRSSAAERPHVPIYMSIKPREEITGGKGYRDDRPTFGVKEEEELNLSSRPSKIVTRAEEDLSEVRNEVDKLTNLPVTEETEEEFKTTISEKPCCACCKEEVRVKEPVLRSGYLEATAAQATLPAPPPSASPSQLLNPAAIAQSPQTAFPGSTLPNPIPIAYSHNPLVQSYYTPVQPIPTGGGAGCGCAPPPQICCQPVQPCCMPTLPCCPPPPPIPCCPQVSICCQPIVPCCLPQICLPTIPLCFRGCPACPCRRRRSLDDPRHHSRTKRQSCMRRVKRDGSCRQCSNWNAITQAAGGGCGTCNGSHRRIKRLGCLPCGRKKRETLAEEEHIRQKRSCLPCLNGRKKREAPGQGSCRKCSLLQTFVTRHKRSFNCSPCGGRKKRSPISSSCPCASQATATANRMKRAVLDFDTVGAETCDRNCCDYSKCRALRARKLDLKN